MAWKGGFVNIKLSVFCGILRQSSAGAPFHVRQDSIIHGLADKVVKMPGETEDCIASGSAPMHGGVKLRQAYAGTGCNERVRFFADYFSRLSFMESIQPPGDDE